jgi:hypothetical protein
MSRASLLKFLSFVRGLSLRGKFVQQIFARKVKSFELERDWVLLHVGDQLNITGSTPMRLVETYLFCLVYEVALCFPRFSLASSPSHLHLPQSLTRASLRAAIIPHFVSIICN